MGFFIRTFATDLLKTDKNFPEMIRYLLFVSMILTIPAFSQIEGNDIGKMTNSLKAVSKKNIDKESIRIYPNPASEFVKVQNAESVDYLKIYNILGVEVKSYKVAPQDSFDIHDLPNGLYFAQLVNKEAEIIKSVRFYKKVYRP